MTLIEIATVTQERLDQAQALLEVRAGEIEEIKANHAEEIKSLHAERDAFASYKAMMETRVAEVLVTKDTTKFVELATDFLAPAQEREKQAKLSQIAELEAQAAALKAELPAE